MSGASKLTGQAVLDFVNNKAIAFYPQPSVVTVGEVAEGLQITKQTARKYLNFWWKQGTLHKGSMHWRGQSWTIYSVREEWLTDNPDFAPGIITIWR